MRIQTVCFSLLALVAAVPLLAAQAPPPSEYSTLLAALKAGNTKIDYSRLRLSYIDSEERKKARDTSDAEKAMLRALQAKDFAEALKQADAVLSAEYVNMDAHYVASIANRELGAGDKADFHRAVFHGLIDSILNSGDGKSPEKAWVVINVHEEYVVLRFLRFRPSQQSLLNSKGHSYDEMKVKDVEDGSDQTFYFNVDIPMKYSM